MSERVFIWRGTTSSESASSPVVNLDGLDVNEVVWSSQLEAFARIGNETPVHLSDAGALEGNWVAFLDPPPFQGDDFSLALVLDYARFYRLRTIGLLTKDRWLSARPEAFALDAVLVREAEDAEKLKAFWRSQDLDLERAPPIYTIPEGTVSLREILCQLPPIMRLILLEGSLSTPSDLVSDASLSGMELRRLKWRESALALSPLNAEADTPRPGSLLGSWAVLPLASSQDNAEAMAIVDEAKGLGLKVAIVAGEAKLEGEYGRLPTEGADIVFFPSAEKRSAALDDAFRFDEKIALLRDRWRVAKDTPALLAELRDHRPRLTSPAKLSKLTRIYFPLDDGEGATLRAEIEAQGIATEPFDLGAKSDDASGPAAKSGSEWLLIRSVWEPNLALLDNAKAAGLRVAVVVDAFDEEAAERPGALRRADVVLTTSWPVTAQVVRTLFLAGETGAKVVPCSSAAIEILEALSRSASPAGWPLSAIVAPNRPLLTCAITTYNRAAWLKHSLKLLLDAAAPWRDKIEIVVCDNASTDDTPLVAQELLQSYDFAYHRNPVNVGMLGNLGATARHCTGAYVWIVGDDDLVVAEGLEIILEGIEKHPDAEMIYLNYAYTRFNEPDSLTDARGLIEGATPIGFGGPNQYAKRLADVAAYNENLFTAIYACVFRRDHALRGYQLDTRGAPFSSLQTCVPSSVYALEALQERPAYWIGFPVIVVNMNVSWLRWALLWHLERMPDLHDMAEAAGVDPARIDRHRFKHCWNAGEWLREALFESEEAIRAGVSVARLIERCKHIEIFRDRELEKVVAVYRKAWDEGRVIGDVEPAEVLFARYGLPVGSQIASSAEKL